MIEIVVVGKIFVFYVESDVIISYLQMVLVNKGKVDVDVYVVFCLEEVEVEVVYCMIQYVKVIGCLVYFVYISMVKVVWLIREVKWEGFDVLVEICLYYVLFSYDDLWEKGFVVKCVFLFRLQFLKEVLIDMLIVGNIDMVFLDYFFCCFFLKWEDNMFLLWGGISGGQFILLVMF